MIILLIDLSTNSRIFEADLQVTTGELMELS